MAFYVIGNADDKDSGIIQQLEEMYQVFLNNFLIKKSNI